MKSNNKGFTAIEVLLSLLIVMLLAGTAIMSFSVLGHFSGLDGAKKITAALDSAGVTAMSSRDYVAAVLFETEGNYYIGQVSADSAAELFAFPSKKDSVLIGKSDKAKIFVAGEPLADESGMVFAFDKASGAFAVPKATAKDGFAFASFDDGVCKIVIDAKPARTVVLTELTGRSYLEETDD